MCHWLCRLFYHNKIVWPLARLVYLPSNLISRLQDAWTYRLCYLFHRWCYMLSDRLFVYPEVFVSLLWNVIISFFFNWSQYDGFSGKWLRAAAILASLCPLFLTIQAIIPLQEDILDVQFLRPLLYLGRCERNHLEYFSSRFGSGSIFIDSHSCYYRLFLHSPCEGPSLQTIFHPFQGNRSWWNDPLANCLCDLSSS